MGKQITHEEGLKIFQGAFQTWNQSLSESYKRIKALQASNPDAHGPALLEAAAPTVACYASGNETTLWPTMGDGPCKTPEAIADYFAHFAAKNPAGVVNGTPDIEITYTAEGDARICATGKYTFTMDDGKGNRVDVACRFGFKLREQDGAWKWYHHNSEVLPSSQLGVKMTPSQPAQGCCCCCCDGACG